MWEGKAAAFAQDIKATHIVTALIEADHYRHFEVWERAFCLIALGHCEGPDHLARVELAAARAQQLVDEAPAELRASYVLVSEQARRALQVVGAFGRHPHRNAALDRISTIAEEAYIAKGEFPHSRDIPMSADGLKQFVSSERDSRRKARVD